MKKFLTLFLIFAVVSQVLFTTACGEKDVEKAVETAAKTSPRVSQLIIDASKASVEAFQAGHISLQKKDEIVGFLNNMAKANVKFIASVENVQNIINRLKEIRAEKKLAEASKDKQKIADLTRAETSALSEATTGINSLVIFFDAEIVSQFTKVLQTFDVLSGEKAQLLALAINSLRTLIITLGRSFKVKSVETLPEVAVVSTINLKGAFAV